jgi:hypothetical protein
MLSRVLLSVTKKTQMTMYMMYIGSICCFGVYFFIVYRSCPYTLKQAPELSAKPLTIALLSLGALFCAAGVTLCRGLFGSGWPYRLVAGSTSGVKIPGMDEREKELLGMVSKSLPLYITALGMVQTCALFGMVAAMQTETGSNAYPFMAAALIGSIFCKPGLVGFIETRGR